MSVERRKVRVDVISDCVCPWCYVGKRRLDDAIGRVADRLEVQVVWHPFQLDPRIPPEGLEWKAYARERFGSLERLREIHQRLVAVGEEVEIPFAFERVERAVNTHAAHRLLAIALEEGKQHEVVERIFAAHFVEGRDIGSLETLAAIAEEAGLDREGVLRALREGRKADEVNRELDAARQIGVQGVPFFIVGGRLAVQGAQPDEVLVEALERAAQE
jgi:predicted DsbA family dithiol-disulfide isomerase